MNQSFERAKPWLENRKPKMREKAVMSVMILDSNG